MHNKLYRLFIIDPQFRMKFIIFLIILSGLGWQSFVLKQKGKDLVKIKAEQALVVKTAEMHEALSGNNSHKFTPMPSTPFNLQGITMIHETYIALIDGKAHKEGDLLNNYTIQQITKNTVSLEDKETKAIKQLYLIH